MSELAIGIDLGTSNSCVALARGRKVEVLPNAYGENITASVVAFQEDGNIVVGNAAKANVIHDPHNTVYSAKRLIGRYFFSEEVKKAQAVCSYSIVGGPAHSVRIQVRDEQFSLPEISAMVLREMKLIAEERLGHEVRKAVITVPAYFNDNQRQATKDAGRIAGLEVLRLLNEPTAAALSYGFGRGLEQRVAVYDLGGGTFDISVLEIGKDVFEVLSTCGDTYLGGDDFDDRLIDLIADEFAAREGINLRNDVYALEKLKLAAENAKKGLSVEDEVEINIPDIIAGPDGEPRSIQRRITAAEFSSLVMDLIQRTFKVCDEALQQANLIARDLDGVILVGGPTRLPVIRQAVREYFQQDPKTDIDPDEVVSLGAAIHGASLVSSNQEAYLLDVTPLSLKIGVAGGLAETVIERNTPVPIEQSRAFTTFQDDQESVNIRVYQGESRQAGENELLGQFEFSGFKRARRGEVQIDVSFEINSDGLVNVTASDQETGQQSSTQITLSSGLSEQEISNIIGDAKVERVRAPGSDSDVPVPPGGGKAAGSPVLARVAPSVDPGQELELLGSDGDDLEVLDDDSDVDLLLDEDPGASLGGPGLCAPESNAAAALEPSMDELPVTPEEPVPFPAPEPARDASVPPSLDEPSVPAQPDGVEVDAGEVELGGIDVGEIDVSGVEADGIDVDGVDVSGVDADGIDVTGIDVSEIDVSEIEAGDAGGHAVEGPVAEEVEFDPGTEEPVSGVASGPKVEASDLFASEAPDLAGADPEMDAIGDDGIQITPIDADDNAATLPGAGIVLDEADDAGEIGLADLEEFEITAAPGMPRPTSDDEIELQPTLAEGSTDEAEDSLFADADGELSSLYEDDEV